MKYRISIICSYNKKDILESMLLPSLDKQEDVGIELSLIESSKENFKSAAAAYNKAVKETSSDFIVFVHQDISLIDTKLLYKVCEYLSKNNQTIVGLNGATYKNKKPIIYSNIYHGILNKTMGVRIDEPVEVETLDECFIAMKKDVLEDVIFDEMVCDGWHFYAVDFCLSAKIIGYRSYVLPHIAQHKNIIEMPNYMYTSGILGRDFYDIAKKVREKHKNNYKIINAPCAYYSTNRTRFMFFYYTMILRMKVKSNVRKLSFRL